MNISMNELKAALCKCFEASGYFVGNYEDASNMVLWLEKHGLNGLKELKLAMPYIYEDTDKPFSQVIYEDCISATIDAHDRSALNCVSAAVDLAHAKVLKSGIATVTIYNCHNRIFVLKALADCARDGISALAYWQNGSETITEHSICVTCDSQYPTYTESSTDLIEDYAQDKQALTIMFSTRVNICAELQNSVRRIVTPEQIAQHQQHAIEHGITIDPQLWQEIMGIASGVLVANSAMSALDAGGR